MIDYSLFEMIDDKDDYPFEMTMTIILRAAVFIWGHPNRNAPENSVRRGGGAGIVRRVRLENVKNAQEFKVNANGRTMPAYHFNMIYDTISR